MGPHHSQPLPEQSGLILTCFLTCPVQLNGPLLRNVNLTNEPFQHVLHSRRPRHRPAVQIASQRMSFAFGNPSAASSIEMGQRLKIICLQILQGFSMHMMRKTTSALPRSWPQLAA